MVKRISIAHRRRNMTRDNFALHWLGPHVDIARRIPGIRGYVINLVDHPDAVGFDGIAETWFDSVAAAEAGFGNEPIQSLLVEDRPKFLDRVEVFFVEEHQVIETPWSKPRDNG